MADGIVLQRFVQDGVQMVRAPDGSVYTVAEVERYNNPGMDFDDITGEPLMMRPTIADSPTTEARRDLGSRVGNEDLAAGLALANPLNDVSLYSLLDPEGAYAQTPLGYINRNLARVPDAALGAVMAGGGLLSKAMGYGSDAFNLGLRPSDVPDLEAMGQVGDALYALPTSRMLGSLNALGARGAAVDTALEAVDPALARVQQYKVPDYAYMTHEAQPYAAVGRSVLEGDIGVDASPFLPGATRMTADERAAFAANPKRSWVDPSTGGDILSQEVGARTLPTLQGQGIYQGPDGLEMNPLSIGRSYATPEQLQATESLRGLLDVQGATPWVRLRQGDLPAVYFSRQGPADADTMLRMQEVGGQYGLGDVIDVGEGYIATDFSGQGQVTRQARKALEEVSGLRGIRSTAQSGYPAYEGAWERGAGQAIRRYLENIQGADENAVAALEASPAVHAAARDRAALARTDGQSLGGSNRVVEEMLRTVGRGDGFMDRLPNYAERLEARRIDQPVPLFNPGVTPEGRATHFSRVEGLGELDPSKYGTNPRMRGAELALPSPYPAQTYFGMNVDAPGGYVKEGALGDVRYDLPQAPSNLLDLAGGWGDIDSEARAIVQRMEDASGARMTPAERDATLEAYRMRIAKMQGYGGLYNPQGPSGPIATSFYPLSVSPQ